MESDKSCWYPLLSIQSLPEASQPHYKRTMKWD
jgi:hypothetical protein